ncbi:hypothetical protein MPER_01887, partial [Moniliophthora perniciosa FA553]
DKVGPSKPIDGKPNDSGKPADKPVDTSKPVNPTIPDESNPKSPSAAVRPSPFDRLFGPKDGANKDETGNGSATTGTDGDGAGADKPPESPRSTTPSGGNRGSKKAGKGRA